MAEGGAIRELLAVFGFGADEEALKNTENRFQEFGEKIKHLVEGLAAAFAVEQIYEFAEANVKAMTSIEHASERLGISTDKVQEFQFAAKSMGLEAESLINMMGRLQVTQQAAAEGGKEQSKAFSQIGVSVKDASGHMKSADELFADVAEGIKNIKDPSQQAAVAVHLFGRQGRELLPFLKEGRAGVAELGAEYRKLGGGYTEDAIKKSKDFEKQSARLGLVWTGLKSTIMSALLKPLTWIIEKVGAAVSWFKSLSDSTRLMEIAFGMLGAAMLAWAAPMMVAAAPILLLSAALAGIALIINSIIRMLEGKQSFVGDAIDKLFGKDAHLEVVRTLKETWESVSSAIKNAWGWLKEMYAILKPIGDMMGEIMAKMLSIGDKLNQFGWAKFGKAQSAVDSATGKAGVDDLKDKVKKAYIMESLASVPAGSYGPQMDPQVLMQRAFVDVKGGGMKHDVSITVSSGPEFSTAVDHRVAAVNKQINRNAANTRRKAPNPS